MKKQRWLIHVGNEDSFLDLFEDGKIIEICKDGSVSDVNHTWEIVGQKMIFNFYSGSVRYTCPYSPFYEEFTGYAIKESGGAWPFKIKKILGDIYQSNKVEGSWSFSSNLGRKIIKIDKDGKVEVVIYDYLKRRQLDTGLHCVKIVGSTIILTLYDDSSTYTGQIGGNTIIGTAKNTKGVISSFRAEKIVDELLLGNMGLL